ncbi:MAG: hypothetical protein LUC93_03625 [Planctomycetaceae bacterium]|nr:hypothetical protein [Planctomycetaceae bacterium]
MAFEQMRAKLHEAVDACVDALADVAAVVYQTWRDSVQPFLDEIYRKPKARVGPWWIRAHHNRRRTYIHMPTTARAARSMSPWYPSGRRRDRVRPARLAAAFL